MQLQSSLGYTAQALKKKTRMEEREREGKAEGGMTERGKEKELKTYRGRYNAKLYSHNRTSCQLPSNRVTQKPCAI